MGGGNCKTEAEKSVCVSFVDCPDALVTLGDSGMGRKSVVTECETFDVVLHI